MARAIVLLFMIIVAGIESARILAYFPTPSFSHQIVFHPITQELARRGHEVVVVTPNPVFTNKKAPANLTEIDVEEISYNSWKELFINHRGKRDDLLQQILSIFERFATVFDLQMQTPQVQNMLKNKGRDYFDILLLEACNRPVLGFAEKFDAPVILISSFGAIPAQYNDLGAPSHPLLYPSPGRHRSYNLTFWEKGLELIKNAIFDYIIATTEVYDNQIARKHFGEDLPTLEELRKRVQMMFVNEHPLWADNHPVPPSIQFLGGLHLAEEKTLPKDLKEYLDNSKHGVIYVSFGTNVLPSLLQPEQILTMTKVFSKLPYNILWKWDTEAMPEQPKNIKTFSWIPQADVLRHPNVKLFITQGGVQSTDEAIDAAVPLIGIPMLGDQWYNVEKYVYHGIGLQLDITKITEQSFKEAIQTVIEDKSYENNILRLRTLMRSYQIKPLDNAVWWIEHVIAHGGSHLQSPAVKMSWIEYYEVKLVLTGIALLGAILVLIGYIFKVVLTFISRLITANIKFKIQ